MSSAIPAWPEGFREVYHRGVRAYQTGARAADKMFGAPEIPFLKSIGCTPQELFDFVDDFQRYGEPSYETTFLVSAIRREYFLTVQHGKASHKVVPMSQLPAKTDEVRGIAWLPRLIEKARIKLRGEMDPDLMYGCGGDRPFLKSVNLDLPDFLRLVWNCGTDTDKIVDAVIASRSR